MLFLGRRRKIWCISRVTLHNCYQYMYNNLSLTTVKKNTFKIQYKKKRKIQLSHEKWWHKAAFAEARLTKNLIIQIKVKHQEKIFIVYHACNFKGGKIDRDAVITQISKSYTKLKAVSRLFNENVFYVHKDFSQFFLLPPTKSFMHLCCV